MENLFALYEALLVWEQTSDISRGNEWTELANIGLGLLLGCVATEKLEMFAMSSAKIHNLIHSREPSSTEEVCYMLEALHNFVCDSISGESRYSCLHQLPSFLSIMSFVETKDAGNFSPVSDDTHVKEFVVPLIRDLLDNNFERLHMAPHLSELPPTSGSPSFFEDFIEYCVSNEWKVFITNCVRSD